MMPTFPRTSDIDLHPCESNTNELLKVPAKNGPRFPDVTGLCPDFTKQVLSPRGQHRHRTEPESLLFSDLTQVTPKETKDQEM